MPFLFDVADSIAPEVSDAIANGLARFNAEELGASGHRELAVTIELDGRLAGGLVGMTAWNWLFIKWLWIDDAHRGQGLGARALALAEDEAIRRGCTGAWLDTLNADARRLYERCGFCVFGELPDFQAGRARVFMQKRFE